MGSGGKGGGKVQVTEHYMSIHMGVCVAGEGIELLGIKVGEKEAWRGELSRSDVLLVSKPDLFGGDKKEGGIRGMIWWLDGNPNQVLPGPLSSRLGLTPTTCPGFRGLASVFFTGFRNDDKTGTSYFWPSFPPEPEDDDDNPFPWLGNLSEFVQELLAKKQVKKEEQEQKGFHWCTNNPYLKAVSVRVRRASVGLNPSIALIQIPDDSAGNNQYASNPAHIVFETMTNTDWGMGESIGAFNIGSFEDAAQTLYEEGFGLNLIWTRQSKIEDFIKEVLDHIQGAVFVDPATGKHTMKLLRAVPEDVVLKQITPDNAQLTKHAMKLWGEISNEVVVTWTNPENGKEQTVTAQDLAGMAMQGAPASSSRNYHGIPYQSLAITVAERDLAAVVNPIATMEAEVTKEFWQSLVYDTVEVVWPERQIDSVIFRISNVTAGSKSHTVKLSLYEDVYSLDRASYLSPEESQWVNPSLPPEPLTNYQLGTAPAFLTATALGLNDISELPYPEVLSSIVVGPDSTDDVDYELIGYGTSVLGEVEQRSLGTRNLRGTWTTDMVLPQETETLIPEMLDFLGIYPGAGEFLLIGDGSDEDTEIAVVISVGIDGYTLGRGMLDTVPKEWPIGTQLWAINDFSVPDAVRRSAFETASYHLLTRTSIGQLRIADAPMLDIVLSERPHLPNRPADVKVGGTAFGSYLLPDGGTVEITWANRNRLGEASQALLWEDGSVTVEAGQTTRIYVMETDRTPIVTFSGLTGTSYTLARSSFAAHGSAIVRVVAVRDDLESLQGHEITINVVGAPVVFDGDDVVFDGDPVILLI